jgi:hypothetical protein
MVRSSMAEPPAFNRGVVSSNLTGPTPSPHCGEGRGEVMSEIDDKETGIIKKQNKIK